MFGRLLVGAHLSITPDHGAALRRAGELGMSAMACFVSNPRRWAGPKKRSAEQVEQTRSVLSSELGWDGDHVLVHGSYLTNIAHPEEDKWKKSVRLLAQELEGTAELGFGRLNIHPGAALGAPVDEAVDRIAHGIVAALGRVESKEVKLVLECVAGAGTTLGRTFEELGAIRERAIEVGGEGVGERVGICLDTAHMIAAGYDLEHDMPGVLAEFDRVCGGDTLMGIHLNDSVHPRGSRKDRHAPIGKGCIGVDPFAHLLASPLVEHVPMVLETPSATMVDDLRILSQLASAPR